MTVNFLCDLPGEFATPIDDTYREVLREPMFYSVYASLRVRCMLPLATVGAALPARLVSYPAALRYADRFGADDVFVLFKIGAGTLHAQPALVDDICTFLDARGGARIYDTCDPQHLEGNPLTAKAQAELLRRADLVCCGTEELLDEFTALTATPVRMIEDAVDCPQRPPVPMPGDPGSMVWFGWMTDKRAAALAGHLGAIAEALPDRRWRCLVLAQPPADVWLKRIKESLPGRSGDRIHIEFQTWQLPASWDAISRHHVALVPQDSRTIDRFKSHNRVSTAIQRGTFAVASPLRSYRPLADFCWLGENLADGVAWAAAHPEETRSRVVNGQNRVAELYAPDVIGRKWIALLKEIGAR